MTTSEEVIGQLGEIAIHNFKGIDPKWLEGTSNLLYEPVKYRIAGLSNLVGSMVGTGAWVASTVILGPTPSVNKTATTQFEWGKLSVNVDYGAIFAVESQNKIGRETILSGDSELSFVKRHNIENEFGIIIDIANKTFVNKDYQTQVELLADPESEEWETLVFRFYVNLTGEEFLQYQKRLTKGFVSAIQPNKRNYFSLSIEPT